MGKLVKLSRWRADGGWWWEVEGDAGRVTEYRTDRGCNGIWVRVDGLGAVSHWSRVAGPEQVSWPKDFHGMLLMLARDGHDISAVPEVDSTPRVPFAFGEKDTGRGDV